ncbi:YncE family protein [Pseudomonas fluorescens]|uniref:Protein nirF n=1 Tax=Pseudomonas fluorescens TaxID=294 RepID=A0A5E7DPI1_PSEFL|nr:YncE family protein [Pseudomonas fluorescens]VVO09102.1 hypothetical protein PS691_03255 [Pseudomonas fluorescens]
MKKARIKTLNTANEVIRLVKGGRFVFSPDNQYLHIHDYGRVRTLDIEKDAVVNESEQLGRLSLKSISPDGKFLYGYNSRDILSINAETLAIHKEKTPGGDIMDVTLSPDGKRLLVTIKQKSGNGSVEFFNSETLTIDGYVDVGKNPRATALKSGSPKFYVNCGGARTPYEEPSIHVFKAEGGTPTLIPLKSAAPFWAFSPHGDYLYLGHNLNWDPNQNKTITIIDTLSDTVYKRDIVVGKEPKGLSFSADGERLFLLHSSSGKIEVYETKDYEHIDTIDPQRGQLNYIQTRPDNGEIWVSYL